MIRKKLNRTLRDVLRRAGSEETEKFCQHLCIHIWDRVGPVLPHEFEMYRVFSDWQYELGMCAEFPEYPRSKEVWG